MRLKPPQQKSESTGGVRRVNQPVHVGIAARLDQPAIGQTIAAGTLQELSPAG